MAKRAYDSSRRQAQAALTRRSMLDAAHALFVRDGYVPTTMDAIAAEAGVALKTVYAAFTTKAGLLRALWDVLLKGDADDAPVDQRAWFQAMVGEKSPRKQVELLAANSVAVKQRIGGLLGVIRDAAVVDGDAAALWTLIQSDFHANQRMVVEAIDRNGGLRAGLDVTTATDILWTLNHPSTWLLLVGERGWTAGAFESWFRETVRHQLLGRSR